MTHNAISFSFSALTYCAILLATLAPHPLVQAKEDKSVRFLNNEGSATPFSPAVLVGKTLYLSGQLGLLPTTGKVASGGIQAETRQAMQNIKSALESSGYTMKDIIKCTVFLVDMSEFNAFNNEYLSHFAKPYPARSAIGVNALAFGGRVEVECMAAK